MQIKKEKKVLQIHLNNILIDLFNKAHTRAWGRVLINPTNLASQIWIVSHVATPYSFF